MRLFFYVTLQRKSEQKTMKKSLLIAGILATSAVFISGCSKDDTEAPVITLNGDNPYQLEMLQTYSDPGATADDNEDGDLSSSISVDASDIENRLPGSYEVNYSVSDAAGNSGSASREVIVYATTNALAKTYNVADTCGSGASAVSFAYTQTVTANNSTTIGFNKFGDYSGNTGIVATLNSDGSVSMALQTALDIGSSLDDHRFSGSGSVTLNGFKIEYQDENITTSSIATCRAWFTRQ